MVQHATGAELIQRARRERRDLLGHEALWLLEQKGFPVPVFRFLPHGQPLTPETLAGLPYPVVAKAVSRQIVHKTEAGAVRLHIGSEDALREAIQGMEESIRLRVPGAGIEGWLVCAHVPNGTEIIAGTTLDPQFGPAIMVGIGGVFTEVYKDVTFRTIPLTAADAGEMIGEIKAQVILDGFRGQPPVSRPKLSELLALLSSLVEENPDIVECDLNPVICRGESVTVVDARVKVKDL
jgi:acyl-CoA synthetase (NDP forming)